MFSQGFCAAKGLGRLPKKLLAWGRVFSSMTRLPGSTRLACQLSSHCQLAGHSSLRHAGTS